MLKEKSPLSMKIRLIQFIWILLFIDFDRKWSLLFIIRFLKIVIIIKYIFAVRAWKCFSFFPET